MVAASKRWISVFNRRIECRTRLKEPMSLHTTLGVGGPADLLAWIGNEADLANAWEFSSSKGIAHRIMGIGSNVLVSDQGLAGVTVKLSGKLASIKVLDSSRGVLDLEVGCGCTLNKLLLWAQDRGAGGLEGLVGIPGTVGGAIKLNAGTRVGNIGDRLFEARLLRRGRLVWVGRADLKLGYRSSSIGPRQVIVAARFRLPLTTKHDVQRAYETVRRTRSNQPRGVRSAGCFFKNPAGTSAGRLIEAAGCKGDSLGGAVVSVLHANYILNVGGAKASDILRLARRVMLCVRASCGVKLEREVELWGWARKGTR